jgi:iron complex outermembrane receptor protein
MRAAFQVSKRDGYLSDGYGDDDGKAGRLTFKFDPTADLSILLTGDYFDQSGKGSAAVITPYANPGDPYTGPSTSSGNTILNLAGLPPIGDDGFLDNKYWGVTGSLDWQTSAGTLTIIPAYRSTRLNYLHYAAGFPVSNTEDDKQQSLEVRFASNDEGALRWLVGAYGFQEDIDFALLADQAVTSSYVAIPDLKSQSWAAFTQVTFAATDTLRLVGGLRYNHDRKEQEGTRTAPLPVGPPPAIVCPAPATVSGANCVAPVVGDADWSKLTWKAGVEIDVAPQSLLYFNVGTGFRAGGFFPSLAPNTFDPEQLLAYTLGSKNRFFDSTLQFNAEAYYWKYKDKQTTHLGPVSPAGFDLITENAGNATIYGIDTETLWLVTAQDQVAVQLQYEHSKYDDFRYNQFSGAPIGQPVTACATATTGSITAVDCSGRPLPLTPEWVAILAYDHTFALPDDAQVVFGLSSRYETSKWLANEYVAGEYQGSSHKTDVDVSYRSPQKIWSITAYVRNIEDAAVKSSTFVQPIIGVPFVVQQPPRTYGMRVAARF